MVYIERRLGKRGVKKSLGPKLTRIMEVSHDEDKEEVHMQKGIKLPCELEGRVVCIGATK